MSGNAEESAPILREEMGMQSVDDNGRLAHSPSPDMASSKDSPPTDDITDRPTGWRLVVLLVLRIGASLAIIYDTAEAFNVHERLGVATFQSSDEGEHLTRAWLSLSVVGVATALLMLWDMFVESAEDLGILVPLHGWRIPPHHELFLVCAAEEIPQSAILLHLVNGHGVLVAGRRASDGVLATVLSHGILQAHLDAAEVLIRIVSSANKLWPVIKKCREPDNRKMSDIFLLSCVFLMVLSLISMSISFNVYSSTFMNATMSN